MCNARWTRAGLDLDWIIGLLVLPLNPRVQTYVPPASAGIPEGGYTTRQIALSRRRSFTPPRISPICGLAEPHQISSSLLGRPWRLREDNGDRRGVYESLFLHQTRSFKPTKGNIAYRAICNKGE